MFCYIVCYNHLQNFLIFNRYYDAKRFCDLFYNEDSFIIEKEIKTNEM